MQIELKPCPFCGGEARITYFEHGADYNEAHISCMICGATIKKRCYFVMVEKIDPITNQRVFVDSGARFDMDAMDLWNRRVDNAE